MTHQNKGSYAVYYTDGMGVERQAGFSITEAELRKREEEYAKKYHSLLGAGPTKYKYYKLIPVEIVIEQVVTIKEKL